MMEQDRSRCRSIGSYGFLKHFQVALYKREGAGGFLSRLFEVSRYISKILEAGDKNDPPPQKSLIKIYNHLAVFLFFSETGRYFA